MVLWSSAILQYCSIVERCNMAVLWYYGAMRYCGIGVLWHCGAVLQSKFVWRTRYCGIVVRYCSIERGIVVRYCRAGLCDGQGMDKVCFMFYGIVSQCDIGVLWCGAVLRYCSVVLQSRFVWWTRYGQATDATGTDSDCCSMDRTGHIAQGSNYLLLKLSFAIEKHRKQI